MPAEKVARLEKESQSLKRISEEVFRVQKQLDAEKVAREAASGQLQSDLQQLLSKLCASAMSMHLLYNSQLSVALHHPAQVQAAPMSDFWAG